MDKKQREARRQQEDIALQRGLLWVVGAVVLEALLVLLNRFYFHADLETEVNIYLGLHEVLRVMRMAAPVAVVVALVWTAWQLKQGKKFGLPLRTPKNRGKRSLNLWVFLLPPDFYNKNKKGRYRENEKT